MESQEAQMEKRLRDMPQSYRSLYKKAMQGRSLKSAAQAFCLECICWQREEVKLCTALACPLYPYRPYQDVKWKRHKRPIPAHIAQLNMSRKLEKSKKPAEPRLFTQ